MHQIDLPAWAVARGAALNGFEALEEGATALVNIDMQNIFVGEGEIFGNLYARDIVGAVNALAAAMRAIGAPVIWTRQTHAFAPPLAPATWQYDLARPEVRAAVEALQVGAAGHELYPAMEVTAGDIVIDTYRYGAL